MRVGLRWGNFRKEEEDRLKIVDKCENGLMYDDGGCAGVQEHQASVIELLTQLVCSLTCIYPPQDLMVSLLIFDSNFTTHLDPPHPSVRNTELH